MLPSSRGKNSSGRISRDECGAIIPFFALIIIPLLALIGLAVDSGFLFWRQLALQKSCDAAALTASSAMLEPIPDEDQAKQIAQERFFNNLALEGVSPAAVQGGAPNIIIDTAERTIRVTANIQSDLFIIKAVPGIGSNRLVAGASQVTIPQVIASLILDTSGSMTCPIGNDNPASPTYQSCSCLPNCPSGSGPSLAKQKLLTDAVVNGFLPYYRDGDMLSVVTYRRTANIIINATTNIDLIKTMLTDNNSAVLSSFDLSNVSEAFYKARDSVSAALAANPDQKVAWVYFSDGAPTAMTVALSDPVDAVAPELENDIGIGPGTGSQYHYTICRADWKYLGGPVGALYLGGYAGYSQAGVSGLSKAPVPDDYFGALPYGPPNCSTVSWPGWPPAENAQTELGNCFQSLQFQLPDGSIWPKGGRAAADVSTFLQQFYHLPIALSDMMRKGRGVWYTVSMGQADGSGDTVYNDAWNYNTRKDNFLKRIALDPQKGVDFLGMTTFAQLYADPAQSRGVYFAANPGDDLKNIFRAVAKITKITRVSYKQPT